MDMRDGRLIVDERKTRLTVFCEWVSIIGDALPLLVARFDFDASQMRCMEFRLMLFWERAIFRIARMSS